MVKFVVKRPLAFVFVLLFSFLAYNIAQASLVPTVSSSWVKLKWEELQIDTTGDVSYTWINDPDSDYRFYYAEVGSTVGEVYEWNKLEGTNAWEITLKHKVSDGINEAKSVSKENVIKASIIFDDDHFVRPVEAYVYRQGYFEVTGNGRITFSIPYKAHIELAPSPSAHVILWASLDLWTDDENNKLENFMEFTMQRRFPEHGAESWTTGGWLSVTLPVEDGQVIGFGAEVGTMASTPLPGTFGLLGGGLLIWAIGRKRLKR